MLKKKFINITSIVLLVMLITVTFSACGKKAPVTPQVKPGTKDQVIRYNIGAEPKTVDPALNIAVDGGTVIENAFEGLTRLSEDGGTAPGVAEKWDISDDGLTYTFTLRKDAKWSDGKPVKAQDFEYAWKRALNPDTAAEYAYQLYYLKNGEAYNMSSDPNATKKATVDDVGVKAKDDNTLVVTLEYPTTYFLQLTAFPTYMPVRQDVVEKDSKAWATKPETYICNGPFKMKEWKPKDTLTFVKNENYWNAEKVKLETIEYKMLEQETSYLAAFKTGQLDYIESPPAAEVPKLLEDKTAVTFPELSTYYYAFNISDKVDSVNKEAAKAIKNPKVRMALTLAIDRKAIVENVTKAGQIPSGAYVPTGVKDQKGKDFREGKKEYYNPEGDISKAKKLLAEAGYPEGKGFPKITLLYNTGEGHQNIAQAVQEMWRKNLGIDIELKNEEWKVFQKTKNDKNYEIARGGWVADYNDPMTFLDMWLSNSGNNECGYSNPEYDKKIMEAKTETDESKRMALLHEAEDILMNDMPIIPIYYYVKVACIKDYVKGVVKSPLGFVLFDKAYIQK